MKFSPAHLVLLLALTLGHGQALSRDLELNAGANSEADKNTVHGRKLLRAPKGMILNSTAIEIGDVSPTDTGVEVKKGVAAWYYPPVEGVLLDLGISWFYTYRPTVAESSIVPPPGIEFVPMIETADDLTPAVLEIVSEEPSEYLLGFYEPDGRNNLTVAEAVALWPQLETTAKKLGSPVTKLDPLQSPWLSRFLFEVERNNLTVDFLNIHYYGENNERWDVGTAVEDMRVFLKDVYERYQKPLWVTEFSLINGATQPPTCPSAQTQADFVKAASEMMNSVSYVQRYAYFPLWPAIKGCESELYSIYGEITVIGKAYQSVL